MKVNGKDYPIYYGKNKHVPNHQPVNIYTYIYMSGGQNYYLPAMDMAKVGGPLSVVKVFAQI